MRGSTLAGVLLLAIIGPVAIGPATIGLAIIGSGTGHAATEKRVALVIGVGRYQHAPALTNPANDVRLIGPALQKLDFDVQTIIDPDYETLKQALRDFGRFGLCVANDGVIDGKRVLPEGWVEAAATPAFTLAAPPVSDITHYGYSWWLGEGVMAALGHAGQRIDVFREEGLVVVTLGAFPEPAYAYAGEHNRRNEAAVFTRAVRAT